MPVYRYQYTMFNARALALQVPGVIVEGGEGPSVYKDITAPTESKDDLDGYMAEQGFSYVSTDPAVTPAQQGSQSIAVASATVPGTVIISDTAPVNVTKDTAGPGTSTEVARRDHKHNITTGSASGNPPGTSNAEGSSTSLARADHTHQLASFGSTTGTFCQGDDSRLSNARTPTGAAGGDLSGNYADPTVKQSSVAFALTGVISPTSIGANQNDYNPTGLSTANTLRLTSSAAYNITGLAGGAAGRLITIHNVGANNLTFTHEDVASIAANRFDFRGASSIVLTPDKAIVIQYDAVSSRWRAIATDDPYGTTANTVCQGNDARLVHASSIVTANSNITTTSASFVLITSLTTTPVAGTYLCFFIGNSYNDNTGAGLYVEFAIFAGGSQLTESTTRLSDSVNFNQSVTCIGVATVNGSQAIEARWLRTAGAGTAYLRGPRSLTAIRIG